MKNHKMLYKLTRKGRLAVAYGAVNEIQDGDVGATMTQVARYMHLAPSTYVMDILHELREAGAVDFVWEHRNDGRHVRSWIVSAPKSGYVSSDGDGDDGLLDNDDDRYDYDGDTIFVAGDRAGD